MNELAKQLAVENDDLKAEVAALRKRVEELEKRERHYQPEWTKAGLQVWTAKRLPGANE